MQSIIASVSLGPDNRVVAKLKMILFLAAALVCSACGERREALADGLELIELSKRTSAIVKGSGDFVVFPNVKILSRGEEYIVGLRTKALDNADESSQFSSGLGYFVLDIETRQVRQGLTLDQCRNDSICQIAL